jgi:hypothetical protein
MTEARPESNAHHQALAWRLRNFCSVRVTRSHRRLSTQYVMIYLTRGLTEITPRAPLGEKL